MTRGDWQAAADDLPIGEVVDQLRDTLAGGTRAVLQAPPGAGKTTIVPLALVEEAWCTGTIVVLEPRRLAVRAAAKRMADLLGERVGDTVGYRVRHDTAVGKRTRIEVVTEGILTRRLQHDPELSGVSALVFDEFHERSLDADVGLALALDVVGALRDDLRLLVMSATLDAPPVADLLGAPVISSHGRAHPVEIVYREPAVPTADFRRAIDLAVPDAVRAALTAHSGDVLVFLPGAGEIERVAGALQGPGRGLGPDVDVRRLYGALPRRGQDAAISPAAPGRRKVVLATSIAETSLTIEGVTSVVDAGWRRAPRLDPASGMSRLVTLPVTRAEADQRAGRAGRLGPGVAYRLWGRADQATRRAHPEPEIEVADLTPLALQLAAWGAGADELEWLTTPPDAHLSAARGLLTELGALDDGLITGHGRALASLPAHPRLAQIVVRGAEFGVPARAARVAAALGEGGLGHRSDQTLADRLRHLDDRSPAAGRARKDAARFERLARRLPGERARPNDAGKETGGNDGLLAAFGFPDRLGARRPDQRGEFRLANGRGASVDSTAVLAGADFICALEVDGKTTRSRVRLGVALDEDDIRTIAGGERTETTVVWDSTAGDVRAERQTTAGGVVLARAPVSVESAGDDAFTEALVDGLRGEGLALLDWSTDDRALQARLQFLHRHRSDVWPAVDDETLVRDAHDRIGPFLAGMRRRRDLRRVQVADVLFHHLPWSARAEVDRLAPERLEVPSGNRHRVDYSVDPPVLAVKLQELFGSTDTPAVLGGAVPVVLHLLSPAGRPLQVTQDLPSFWAGAYRDVRADMRGRYPKHPWPEDPASASPTARTKRRR